VACNSSDYCGPVSGRRRTIRHSLTSPAFLQSSCFASRSAEATPRQSRLFALEIFTTGLPSPSSVHAWFRESSHLNWMILAPTFVLAKSTPMHF
jgi:hypothetical protein